MAAIHLDRRGVASRAHLTAALAMEESEAILLRTCKEAILRISIMLEGCHLQCLCMMGTTTLVKVLHQEEGLTRSISTVPIIVSISSTQRHFLARPCPLHCLRMLRQMLFHHHRRLHFLFRGITVPYHHGRLQIRHCFLFFPVLQP
jgi:hypothetical protein